MKIQSDLFPKIYEVAKKVYQEQMKLSSGLIYLVEIEGMNQTSARDYIVNLKNMLDGRSVHRTMSAESVDYILARIKQDFDPQAFATALDVIAKHVEYYEELRNTTLNKLRGIIKRHKEEVLKPSTVDCLDDIRENIETLENYLTSPDDEKRIAALLLIRRGNCFIAYSIGNEIRFCPSRYVGCLRNKPDKPIKGISGGITNREISKILRKQESENQRLELEYFNYCRKLGISPFSKSKTTSKPRKFWKIELKNDFVADQLQNEGFPEGKIVERIHRGRERNFKVISLAKTLFKEKHGKLICQVCKFDFEKEYGEVGSDFIEGHHTIPVSTMADNHVTLPEEIALLCSNCHRMVHRRRPWLTMDQLHLLLSSNFQA